MSYDLPYRGLPRELRDKIYEHLLCPTDGTRILRKYRIARHQNRYKRIHSQLPHIQFIDDAYTVRADLIRMNQLPHVHRTLPPEFCHLFNVFLRTHLDYPAAYSEFACKDLICRNIFLTNHETRAEASRVLFSKSVFDFVEASLKDAAEFLGSLPEPSLAQIRSISLDRYSMSAQCFPDPNPEIFDILHFVASKTRIRSLVLSSSDLTASRRSRDKTRAPMSVRAVQMLKYMLLDGGSVEDIQFHWNISQPEGPIGEGPIGIAFSILDIPNVIGETLEAFDAAVPGWYNAWSASEPRAELHGSPAVKLDDTAKTLKYKLNILDDAPIVTLTLSSKSANTTTINSNWKDLSVPWHEFREQLAIKICRLDSRQKKDGESERADVVESIDTKPTLLESMINDL